MEVHLSIIANRGRIERISFFGKTIKKVPAPIPKRKHTGKILGAAYTVEKDINTKEYIIHLVNSNNPAESWHGFWNDDTQQWHDCAERIIR